MMSTGDGGSSSVADVLASKEGGWAAKNSTTFPSGLSTAYYSVVGESQLILSRSKVS